MGYMLGWPVHVHWKENKKLYRSHPIQHPAKNDVVRLAPHADFCGVIYKAHLFSCSSLGSSTPHQGVSFNLGGILYLAQCGLSI